VIKVESPWVIPYGPSPTEVRDDATYYLAVNRHRRNIVADLRNPDDYERIAQLVRLADAVVENYLPSQVAALGIDRLRSSNPTASGEYHARHRRGPVADLPSFDLLAQARSGLMGVTGDADGPPTKVGAPIADVVTGLYGAIVSLPVSSRAYAVPVRVTSRHRCSSPR